MSCNLYGRQWRKARKLYLADHPLCVECRKRGRLVPATIIDHIIPHRGHMSLFWDMENWQPLCKLCHDSHKQRLEHSGVITGCDQHGIPLDGDHHWAKGMG